MACLARPGVACQGLCRSMRFFLVACGCLLGAAAMLAACSSSTAPEQKKTDVAPTVAAGDAAAWTTPPVVDASHCPKHASYTDCHVCCLLAYPSLIDLVWESFRACACRLPRPLPCAAECGDDYCGESFPMHLAPKACRVCLGTNDDDERLFSCMETAVLACDADRDCSSGLACDLKCPEPLPGESDDDAEDKVFEILDGGAR